MLLVILMSDRLVLVGEDESEIRSSHLLAEADTLFFGDTLFLGDFDVDAPLPPAFGDFFFFFNRTELSPPAASETFELMRFKSMVRSCNFSIRDSVAFVFAVAIAVLFFFPLVAPATRGLVGFLTMFSPTLLSRFILYAAAAACAVEVGRMRLSCAGEDWKSFFSSVVGEEAGEESVSESATKSSTTSSTSSIFTSSTAFLTSTSAFLSVARSPLFIPLTHA
mmetsp:Transcript_345/g.592  ORF Transcript_345/g.592 Transcript_345/m.592 type:complete len:222 (-) Transcript_345:448-1113(-)